MNFLFTFKTTIFPCIECAANAVKYCGMIVDDGGEIIRRAK